MDVSSGSKCHSGRNVGGRKVKAPFLLDNTFKGHSLPHLLQIGCPRNNQIYFFGSNRNKLFRFFFSLFCETKKHFFRFVQVFWTGIKTTETNRIFSKQTEKSLKNVLYQGVLEPVNFFSRLKPKLNLFRLFFGLLFRETKNFFFRFVTMFWTGIETTETNRTYGMRN